MYANPPSPANKRKRAEKENSKPKKKRRSSFSEGKLHLFINLTTVRMRILYQLIFSGMDGTIPFVVGQVYLRQHIHEHYGGTIYKLDRDCS